MLDWLWSLLQGHPGWYDPICSACGHRHAGRVRTDGREYVEYNATCPRGAAPTRSSEG